MGILKNKFKSRRGASLLLALLFLLVSMLVGTSVLMAAAANAGRIQSSRDEQQKYLTLSSALNLMVEELKRVEYVGKYDHRLTPLAGEDDCYTHSYDQTKGELRERVDAEGTWNLTEDVLPLANELDVVFANYITTNSGDRVISGLYSDDEFLPLDKRDLLPDEPQSLTVTLKVGLDPKDYGGLTEPVQITVTADNDGSIELLACLENEPTYRMKAAMRPVPGLINFRLNGHRDDEAPHSYDETEPIKWELDYIAKVSG